MSGTTAGGKAAALTNVKRYGPGFYGRIGSLGGTQTYKSGKLYEIGFAGNRERARIAGALGGRKSRRLPGTSLAAHYRRLKKERENGR